MTTATAATTTRRKPRVSPRDREHRNEVRLLGELATEPDDQLHAGGEEVTAFRLLVRAPRAGGEPGPTERIDCVVRAAGLRTRVRNLATGDVVEIDGVLRHRYWRSGGALADRYEVEVLKCRRVARS